ncbi:hypothetical protein FCM35_KLT06390 [Carex littledalei]|uniref:FLZ-type domain-containing protein n=1 Tax=Carex littledalei TaxID=544730 RepID=A0A833R0K9_9POAL|nr:hypothetical protein FCM35_KLT06390 [Carex littledalei]
MSAVGLQIIATMNLEEGEIGKLSVVGAAKYAALCVGTMPHDIKTNNNNIVEERIGIFYLGSPPPAVEPHVLKMNRCMVCRQRLERQDTFISRGIAFCSPECRSSDEAGIAKVKPSTEAQAHNSPKKLKDRTRSL